MNVPPAPRSATTGSNRRTATGSRWRGDGSGGRPATAGRFGCTRRSPRPAGGSASKPMCWASCRFIRCCEAGRPVGAIILESCRTPRSRTLRPLGPLPQLARGALRPAAGLPSGYPLSPSRHGHRLRRHQQADAQRCRAPRAAQTRPFGFVPNRHRAAMRFRVEPAVAQPAPPQIRT